jgi:predicted dehydrogenase
VSDPDPVRVGVVGLGWWGGVLADAAGRAGLEVTACFARTEASREEFAAVRGCYAASSLAELVASDDVEGVILTTPHSVHAEHVEQIAAAGKHVIVDKPFTLTVAEARRALAATAAAGTILMVGHQRRRQEANRRIKELIDGGDIGTPVVASSVYGVASGYPATWRATRDETPLGAMTGLGVHMIDTFHYLLGPIERVSAYSNEMLEGEPLDHATGLLLEFWTGAVGSLVTTHFAPKVIQMSVHGTKGAAFNEDDGARLFVQKISEGTRTEVAFKRNDELVDQLVAFADAIRGTGPAEPGGAEGMAVVAVLEAAVASAESRTAVEVAKFLPGDRYG